VSNFNSEQIATELIYTVLDVNFSVISGVLIERIACERASEIENEIFSEIDALGEQICVVNSHLVVFRLILYY
jgi:hypothetical protein